MKKMGTEENYKIPYLKTQVSASVTQVQIQDLLVNKFKCSAVQWTKTSDYPLPTLRFIWEGEVRGVRKKLGFAITPTLIYKETGHGKYQRRRVAKIDLSMRLLYWLIKSKMEAVVFGIRTIEQEFLYDIVWKLPTGKVSTIGELVVEQIVEEVGVIQLPAWGDTRLLTFNGGGKQE